MDMRVIPDQSHIDSIRKRLWSGREIGQAAVMVGAGFSRNAPRITPHVPLAPLLGSLAGVMFEALYPVGHWPEEDREYMKVRMTSGGAILRLASEYEIVFGRMALDELILQSIPDSSYNPG